MKFTCRIFGHKWSSWKWIGGWSSQWFQGQNLGPGHSERRACARCPAFEVKELPGKFDGMDEGQLRALHKGIESGELKPW